MAEARQRIQAADDRAWTNATGAGTIIALNQYLGQFPDGTHAAQAQSSVAALERHAADQKPSALTRRFDGTWQSTISCAAAAGGKAFTLQLTAQVKDGNFHGQRGTEGKPTWLTLDGKIQVDGSAELYAQGITGNAAYAIGNAPEGSTVSYHIQAKFEGSSGTGARVELRPCNFTALKR